MINLIPLTPIALTIFLFWAINDNPTDEEYKKHQEQTKKIIKYLKQKLSKIKHEKN